MEDVIPKPIFEIPDDTEARQIWFVGSAERDLMGILYKDAEGWVLKYRWRHYAEPVSRWDPDSKVAETAWDGRDRKSVHSIRPKADILVTDDALDEMSSTFTKIMDILAEKMDGTVWTRKVSNGRDITKILMTAPWAHAKVISKEPERPM